MNLSSSVSAIPNLGPAYAQRLEKLNILTIEDLLFHFPTRYEDFSLVSPIDKIQHGEIVTVQGTIMAIKNEFSRNRKFLQKGKVEDETGSVDLVWFNQTFLTRTLPVGTKVSLAGKVENFRGTKTLINPDYEVLYDENKKPIHTGRLVPIYPETYGVSSKWLRAKIARVLELVDSEIIDYLPESVKKAHQFIDLATAVKTIHFPETITAAQIANRRLAFDEFFVMHLRGTLRKKQWEEQKVAQPLLVEPFQKHIETFWKKLPFELTNAQRKAVNEILTDITQKKPMNRLLEGDVGSGKTVVAAIAMYVAYLNKTQSILMAPTQILALQHFNTISKLLEPLGVKVGQITGGKKISGEFDVLVGTHAVLFDHTLLKNVGLIVVDEQHRFGVEQRSQILKKGNQKTNPHILTMTATPIPRTVALTMYGNLDLSYLDELPKGRKTIKTWVVKKEKRPSAYEWVKEEIRNQKAQVFIICPFIEESENLTTVKAAKKEYEYLASEVFNEFNVGLLHGKMKPKEKEEAMNDFRERKFDILVATPVVEVGVDIPGATIILIEGAERFGLAQLHQLRGRVGRNDLQSYCLLFTTDWTTAYTRLKFLETVHHGARLAEIDLEIRGPGDVYGTAQHGVPKLKVANFSNLELIQETKEDVEKLLKEDPNLTQAPLLKEKIESFKDKIVEPN